MTQFAPLILFLSIGLVSVTIIDTAGAWASRRFKFNYAYLSILQFAVYFLIAFFICRVIGLGIALLINFITALYDATIGFRLSFKFKANFKLIASPLKITIRESLIAMLILWIISTLMGYGLAQFIA